MLIAKTEHELLEDASVHFELLNRTSLLGSLFGNIDFPVAVIDPYRQDGEDERQEGSGNESYNDLNGLEFAENRDEYPDTANVGIRYHAFAKSLVVALANCGCLVDGCTIRLRHKPSKEVTMIGRGNILRPDSVSGTVTVRSLVDISPWTGDQGHSSPVLLVLLQHPACQQSTTLLLVSLLSRSPITWTEIIVRGTCR